MDEINMLSSVIDIVIDASGLMLTDDFRISQKDGAANIVTSSDIAVQEFLCRRLSDLLPGCGFLCEEEDMHDLLHEYTWIIDPIDGTANYSRGISECACSPSGPLGHERCSRYTHHLRPQARRTARFQIPDFPSVRWCPLLRRHHHPALHRSSGSTHDRRTPVLHRLEKEVLVTGERLSFKLYGEAG